MDAISDNSPFTVYCDGAKNSHADRRWTFAPFVRPLIAGVTFPWSEQHGYSGAGRSTESIAGDDRHVNATVARELLAIHEKDRSGANARTRRRFKFECKICGFPVECRYEQIEPIFDTLTTRGEKEISLSGLAAILELRSSG